MKLYIFLLLTFLSAVLVNNLPIKRRNKDIEKSFNIFQFGNPIQPSTKHPIHNIKINKVSNLQMSPIILVGGLGGSSLMAQRNHSTNEPHWWCQRTTDPFQIWLSLQEMIPYLSEDCFVNDMSVELKNGILGQKDRNVRIFGKDIGGMEGLNSIIAEFPSKWYYMKPLADYLVSNGSYEIGKSLRGFTYDWRVGVREWANDSLSLGGDYFKLQKLVEETFKLNGRKVSLLGHSMGGPFLQYFLANFVSQDWKDRYIYKYIPVAGPFDGTSFSLVSNLINFYSKHFRFFM